MFFFDKEEYFMLKEDFSRNSSTYIYQKKKKMGTFAIRSLACLKKS